MIRLIVKDTKEELRVVEQTIADVINNGKPYLLEENWLQNISNPNKWAIWVNTHWENEIKSAIGQEAWDNCIEIENQDPDWFEPKSLTKLDN